MVAIAIGNDNTDRAGTVGGGYTIIDLNNPADGSGIITDLWFRLSGTTEVTVATFELVGTNVYLCRSSQYLGTLGAGLHAIADLTLSVKQGDNIGIWLSTSSLDCDNTGGTGYATKGGNYTTVGDSEYFAPTATRTITLGASGVVTGAGELSSDVTGLLEVVRTDYLPGVRAWIMSNVGYLSFFDYILACFVYSALNAGGPGGLYTGPSLQDIKDVLGTPQENTLADGQVAIVTSFTAQHVEQSDLLQLIADDLAEPTGHLAIAETNIETAVSVAKLAIMGDPAVSLPDVLAAVEAVSVPEGLATAADVSAAVGTLTGEIDEAVTSIDGHTDTALAGLAFATPADVTGAHATTDGKIDTLNNLSQLAVSGLVDAAVGTLTGEVGEAADLVIAAIEALPDPAAGGLGAPVWPGTAGVTFGQTVALTDGLHLIAELDGVIIAITTPPSRTGTMSIGGATFDYREGQIAFEADEGHLEMWQYLGFRNALYVPRTILHAAGARFRVLAGAEGTVTPWTVTP